MKLKLSKAEMQGLEQWLSVIVSSGLSDKLWHKLLIAVMKKFYEKVAKELVVLKNNYSIKMDDATCMAFVLMFDQVFILNPSNHADNLIIQLSNKFKQHYA
jgi:hypothetical protein